MDKVNIKLAEWKKIFTKYKTNKRLTFTITRNSYKCIMRHNNPNRQMSKKYEYLIYRKKTKDTDK